MGARKATDVLTVEERRAVRELIHCCEVNLRFQALGRTNLQPAVRERLRRRLVDSAALFEFGVQHLRQFVARDLPPEKQP